MVLLEYGWLRSRWIQFWLAVSGIAQASFVAAKRPALSTDMSHGGEYVISNVMPRRTTAGDIVNAHDGALYQFEGQSVLIGTSYFHCESFTNCSSRIGDCGWQDNNFSVYVAKTPAGPWDLASDDIIPQRPRGGANFRPKLIYDHKERQYVLWYNYQPPTPNIPGYYNVAVSSSFRGPFKIVSENVKVAQPLNGDFNLLQDDDADRTAYIVYNSDKNGKECAVCHIPPCDCGFQMSVERLNPGYTSSSLENSGFIGAPRVEAPVMFKRAGVYYLLFDRLSCFGPQGSGAVVYTAENPMGPYAVRGNINRYGPYRESQLGFIIIPAQQTYVTNFNGTFIWQGDQWDSYTDPATGQNIKAYDYQVWLPLQFDDDDVSGNIFKLKWQDEWTLP